MADGVSVCGSRVVKAAAAGYRVDDRGIVYSPYGRPIRTTMGTGKSWYFRYFTARIESDSRTVYKVPVHRLAAYQRYGEAALRRGVVSFHEDGDTTNCAPSNMLIGSRTDRMMRRPAQERREHGLRGATVRRKLTDDQVLDLRRRWAAWESLTRLAADFGLSQSTVSYIASGRSYAHLPTTSRKSSEG
jgi:hypothetical protein